MGEYDIKVGTGKTHDSRKSQPKAAGTSNWDPTMLNTPPAKHTGDIPDDKGVKGPYDIAGQAGNTLDARKKVAKPAGTTDWNPTMI
jgi:hypothetical protein